MQRQHHGAGVHPIAYVDPMTVACISTQSRQKRGATGQTIPARSPLTHGDAPGNAAIVDPKEKPPAGHFQSGGIANWSWRPDGPDRVR